MSADPGAFASQSLASGKGYFGSKNEAKKKKWNVEFEGSLLSREYTQPCMRNPYGHTQLMSTNTTTASLYPTWRDKSKSEAQKAHQMILCEAVLTWATRIWQIRSRDFNESLIFTAAKFFCNSKHELMICSSAAALGTILWHPFCLEEMRWEGSTPAWTPEFSLRNVFLLFLRC